MPRSQSPPRRARRSRSRSRSRSPTRRERRSRSRSRSPRKDEFGRESGSRPSDSRDRRRDSPSRDRRRRDDSRDRGRGDNRDRGRRDDSRERRGDRDRNRDRDRDRKDSRSDVVDFRPRNNSPKPPLPSRVMDSLAAEELLARSPTRGAAALGAHIAEERERAAAGGAPAGTGANALPAKKKEEPNFATSGLLAAETNTVNGVTLKWTEPAEARKPNVQWRLYVFKDDNHIETLHISKQSAYLVGRERLIADLPLDHGSISKQHAVIQYRLVDVNDAGGASKKVIKPYLMDLESTNGSFINDKQLEPARYYELKEKDVVKFGKSTREFVLLHADSADGGAGEDADMNEIKM